MPQDPNRPEAGNELICREEFRADINERFDRLIAGQTPVDVAAWANTRPNKIGRIEDWDQTDIGRLVRNPRYKGLARDSNTVRRPKRSSGDGPRRRTIPTPCCGSRRRVSNS